MAAGGSTAGAGAARCATGSPTPSCTRATATARVAALNDTRCAACGSLLFSVVRGGAYVHVAMGSLADAPSIRPSEHIFVGSKAPWFEITDDVPQADEYGD